MIKVKNFIDKYRITVLGIRFWVGRDYEKLVAANYARKRRELQEKFGKEKIRVGFLVRENSKWSYESVYHQMAEGSHFDPIVLIVEPKGKKAVLKNTEGNLRFFAGYHHALVHRRQDVEQLGIDILFYEQPWYDLAGEFTPDKISENALTYYVPYCVEPDIEAEVIAETGPFHKAMTCNFCFSEATARQLAGFGITNTCAVGHPRMDAYLNPAVGESPWQSKGKLRIIYSPHHSFGTSLLKQASWEWSGEHLLKLAQQHQDSTEWILKPHPRFSYELGRMLRSEEKAQRHMDEWAKVSRLYDKGNYFDLFRTADLIISDCVSFNIEWLPTRKPFLRLRSHYPDATVFKTIDYYAEHYYYAGTTAELDACFDMLVHRREDPAREARIRRAQEVPIGVGSAIIDILTRSLTA